MVSAFLIFNVFVIFFLAVLGLHCLVWTFLELWWAGATLQLQCTGFSLWRLLFLESTGSAHRPSCPHFWMGQGVSSLLACLSGFLVAVLFPVTPLPLFFKDFSFTLRVDGFYNYQEVICPLSVAFHCVISENAVSLSLQSCVTKRNITSNPHVTTDSL